MNKQDVLDFIASGTTSVTINTIEGSGHEKRFTILIGYIVELPSIVAQSDGDSQKRLIEEINISYQCMRQYWKNKENFDLPEKLNYTVKMVEPEEFFKK